MPTAMPAFAPVLKPLFFLVIRLDDEELLFEKGSDVVELEVGLLERLVEVVNVLLVVVKLLVRGIVEVVVVDGTSTYTIT